MVKEPFPYLVLTGLSEAYLMIFEGFPSNEQNIHTWPLNASTEFMRNVTWHGSDDPLRFPKSRFEFGRPLRNHLQWGNFQNHACLQLELIQATS
jgi:hypothetical protein